MQLCVTRTANGRSLSALCLLRDDRKSPATGPTLFDRHAFGEIPGLIDVPAELNREVVGEELERNRREDRHQAIMQGWKLNNIGGHAFQCLGAFATGDGNDRSLSRLHLFHVVDVLRKNSVIGSDENRGKIGPNERDDPMLQFRAWMTLGKKIRDLLELKR